MTGVLITGASGFVGQAMSALLVERGYLVRAALRNNASRAVPGVQTVYVGDIGAHTEWGSALEGIDTIVHLAARAHMLEASRSEDHAYFETNSRGTETLAREAGRRGIRRFVYLSSVKVNGEQTYARPFTATDEPNPQDAYGCSKWLGEQALLDAARESTLQAVIVRSPLVYGPGVRANFLRLLRSVEKGWPLPFGLINNARSLVSIWNLTDLILRAMEHPGAVGTWMVSDGRDLSTPELIRMIGVAMGRPVNLVRIPAGMLRAFGKLVGHAPTMERLCGSLAVDISPTRSLLQWEPPVTVEESIARTTDFYLQGRLR